MKKATAHLHEEGDSSHLPSPSSSCCGVALQLHEEGDGNNIVAFFFLLWS
jgi:hypothetical protein